MKEQSDFFTRLDLPLQEFITVAALLAVGVMIAWFLQDWKAARQKGKALDALWVYPVGLLAAFAMLLVGLPIMVIVVLSFFMMVIFPLVTYELLLWHLAILTPVITALLFYIWSKRSPSFGRASQLLLCIILATACAWGIYGWTGFINGMSGQQVVRIKGTIVEKERSHRKIKNGGSQALNYVVLRDKEGSIWHLRVPYDRYATAQKDRSFTAIVRRGGLGFHYYLVGNGRYWLDLFLVDYEKLRGNDINY